MRDIRGHLSRDSGEIVDILVCSGTYTCPTLPHYRYDKVKSACRNLKKLGLVRVSGRNPESENLVVTNLFREWQTEQKEGRTSLGAIRWAKHIKSTSQSVLETGHE